MAQRENRRVVIILIAGLAVVALAFLAARVLSSDHPHPANPAAPLIGAVDRANATAGAANDRNHQLENQIGGATNTTGPVAP